MARIILEGYIVVPAEELATVRQALAEHIRLTHAEPGCLVFRVTEQMERVGVFDVYEEFVDQTAFEAHQQRVKTSDWGAITGNVERNYRVCEKGPQTLA